MFYFHPYLWKMIRSNLTSIFDQIGWFNHQLISWEKQQKPFRSDEWKGWMTFRYSSRPMTCHVTMRGNFTSFMGFPGFLLQGWPTFPNTSAGKYSGSQAKGLHKSGTQRGKRDVWERCVGVEKKGWVKKTGGGVLTTRKTEMTGWRNHHFR